MPIEKTVMSSTSVITASNRMKLKNVFCTGTSTIKIIVGTTFTCWMEELIAAES